MPACMNCTSRECYTPSKYYSGVKNWWFVRNTYITSAAELTCLFTRNIEAANKRKRDRYEFLTTDIEEAGYKCSNLPFEIGSRGHVTQTNRNTLVHLCHVTGIKRAQQVIRNCSKLVLLGSYTIFNARTSNDWSEPSFLKPWSFTTLSLSIHLSKTVTLCDVGGALVPPIYGETALLFCWNQQDMTLGYSLYVALYLFL